MKNSAKMTMIFSTSLFLMALNKKKKKKKKTRFRPGSKYDYQVIALNMLPLRYGSMLTNIILISVLRLSVDPMVWVSTELF